MVRCLTTCKKIGETPLQATERLRREHNLPANLPMAYAGRLDPMAEGLLLVLCGDECKRQERYHGLDKIYEFDVLFGVSSDTGDVLGRLTFSPTGDLSESDIKRASQACLGPITLPYPKFSAKTVQGKPLHTWTLEGKLKEIEIPRQSINVYKLRLDKLAIMSGKRIYELATKKIAALPPVRERKKALGKDFRRKEVKQDWKAFLLEYEHHQFTVGRFCCVCGPGTYMRSLSGLIAGKVNEVGLAFGIRRTRIGRYINLGRFGIWIRKY